MIVPTVEPGTHPTTGEALYRVTFEAPGGLRLVLTNLGATVLAIEVPCAAGPRANITLAHQTYEDIISKGTMYYGVTVGRVANRVAGAAFELDGRRYKLADNAGGNALHGGAVGFDKRVWELVSVTSSATDARAVFKLVSEDGEEGYPGRLTVLATYGLTSDHRVTMDFEATVEGAATPINLCNHAYYNLSGFGTPHIRDHELALDCPFYLPIGEGLVPTGAVTPVEGTIYDFYTPANTFRRIGDRLAESDGGGKPGYDHCFVKAGPPTSSTLPLSRIARLRDPSTGRVMTVETTAPGVQLYTGNFLYTEPEAAPFTQHAALCLETEAFPNAINNPAFPSVVLRPGETYKHTTVHTFEW